MGNRWCIPGVRETMLSSCLYLMQARDCSTSFPILSCSAVQPDSSRCARENDAIPATKGRESNFSPLSSLQSFLQTPPNLGGQSFQAMPRRGLCGLAAIRIQFKLQAYSNDSIGHRLRPVCSEFSSRVSRVAHTPSMRAIARF